MLACHPHKAKQLKRKSFIEKVKRLLKKDSSQNFFNNGTGCALACFDFDGFTTWFPQFSQKYLIMVQVFTQSTYSPKSWLSPYVSFVVRKTFIVQQLDLAWFYTWVKVHMKLGAKKVKIIKYGILFCLLFSLVFFFFHDYY